MSRVEVTSTEFQTRAGRWLDEAARRPVFITRYDRPVRVLIDIEEYERMKRYDPRRSFHTHDLPDDVRAELDKGWQGEPTPDLDHLMDAEPGR